MKKTFHLTQDSKPEFIGQIVDMFEDYLAEHEIMLENEERDDAIEDGDIDEEEAAIIFGDHYDMIGDTVSYAVEKYDLMNNQFETIDVMEMVVDEIIRSFQDVLKDGKYTETIPEIDIEAKKGDIRSIFMNWDLTREFY